MKTEFNRKNYDHFCSISSKSCKTKTCVIFWIGGHFLGLKIAFENVRVLNFDSYPGRGGDEK